MVEYLGHDEHDLNSDSDLSGFSNTKGLDQDEIKYLRMYAKYSGRRLHKLEPTVWTSHGKWTKDYKHLGLRMEKPNRGGAGGASGIVTNREFLSWVTINGIRLQAGLVESTGNDRYVLVFTRASSAPPTYGSTGMFERASTAGRAWCRLTPEKSTTIIAIPRARVASKSPMDDKTSLLGEMKAVLDALTEGSQVEMLSISIDGLTTHVSSFEWLRKTWPHLRLLLVVAVPEPFPGSLDIFLKASNGIRYGQFDIAEIAATVEGSQLFPRAKALLDILQYIYVAKEE